MAPLGLAQGDGRFIPVRSDEQRILTCFLEYADTTVTVHDLLHQLEGDVAPGGMIRIAARAPG